MYDRTCLWPALIERSIESTLMENTSLIFILVSVFACVLVSGVGIAFLVGRSSGRCLRVVEADGQLPERVVKELERCLELRDYVARDANLLSSTVAGQSPTMPGPVTNAIQQLLKTTKSLAGRLARLGAEARISRPELVLNPVSSFGPEPAAKTTAVTTTSAMTIPVLSQTEVDAAPRPIESSAVTLPAGPYDDARRFPRSSFRGTAKATIYPRHTHLSREPVRCDVLTRDLSCGGIGIAHSEQLYPKQIVILDAVSKLLVGEVRWCRRVDENFYVAGCRLVKTNS